MYCAQDDKVETVGSTNKKVGKMSPRNMLTTTITDELRIASNMKSKTIGIALKDRGAILPAGHIANAAFWFDGATGNWVSSSFYMETIPAWVDSFNRNKVYENYLSKPWETLLPISEYTESLADDNPYEGRLKGEDRPVFPHDLPRLYKEEGASVIRYTPFGNSFTKDFAVATIKSEQLGKRGATDFLAVSFSSPDYIGHNWGPHSIEIQDNYLRLDKDLADFISFLEAWVGKENLLVFLTADHGGANVPQYLIDHNVPAGIFKSEAMVDSAMKYMRSLYGNERWILNYENEQFFLNRKLILDKRINLREMQEKLAEFCLQYKGVSAVYTAHALSNTSFHNLPGELVQKGFHQKRSGDVALVLDPGWMEYQSTGTTHGTVYNYDTHVPLLWYGWKINPGETYLRTYITDIAPSISSILNIPFPSGCIGSPLNNLICK
jgi:predicted AlkP superfamily pyrophosphatase or phosphodiesterase